MPLEHSASKEAMGENISELTKSFKAKGRKNANKSAIAAAYRIRREAAAKKGHEKPHKEAAPTGSGVRSEKEKEGQYAERPMEKAQVCIECGGTIDKKGHCPDCDNHMIPEDIREISVKKKSRRPVTDAIHRYQRAGYSMDEAVRAVIHLRRMHDRGMIWNGTAWVRGG